MDWIYTVLYTTGVATAALRQTDGSLANLRQTAPQTTTQHPLTFIRGTRTRRQMEQNLTLELLDNQLYHHHLF